MVTGFSKVSADAALAINQLIGTAADGQADAKTVGTDTTEYVVGNVLVAAGAAESKYSAVVSMVEPCNLI